MIMFILNYISVFSGLPSVIFVHKDICNKPMTGDGFIMADVHDELCSHREQTYTFKSQMCGTKSECCK